MNLEVKLIAKIAVGECADCNAYFALLPGWPEYSPEKPDEGKATGRKTSLCNDELEGVTYRWTATPYSLTRKPDQIVTYDPDFSVLWVGSLLQGQGYKDGIGSKNY